MMLNRDFPSISTAATSLEVVSAYMIRKGAAVEAYCVLTTACALRGRFFVKDLPKTARVGLDGFRHFTAEEEVAYAPPSARSGCTA